MDPNLSTTTPIFALIGALVVVAVAAFVAGASKARRDRRAAASAAAAASADCDQRLEAAELRLLSVLGSSINEAILITDVDNRVRYANTIARTWFDIGSEFAVDPPRRPPLKSVLRSAEMHDLLESLPPGGLGVSDDSELGVGLSPDPDGLIEHTLALRDHVYRVRLQRMDDGGAVISLRDDTEVERLARARRDLVANISHDLRTPLTSIRLLIESLLDAGGSTANGGPSAPEVQRKRITSIRDQAAILERLADGLVQLNRLDTGRALLQLTAHPLAEVVATAVQAVEPQLVERGISVERDIPPDLSVLVDEAQIIRVLTNLLDNALQASRPGTRVLIGAVTAGAPPASSAPASSATASSATALPATANSTTGAVTDVDPGYVELYVQNEGQGISPDDAERIFERFFRGDKARASSGTGLGLAIARHIVEGHGGRIWLDRNYREGARFRFTVPLAD